GRPPPRGRGWRPPRPRHRARGRRRPRAARRPRQGGPGPGRRTPPRPAAGGRPTPTRGTARRSPRPGRSRRPPLPHDHRRTDADLGGDLEAVHEPPGTGEAEAEPPAGRVPVLHGPLEVGDARALVAGDDLDGGVLARAL